MQRRARSRRSAETCLAIGLSAALLGGCVVSPPDILDEGFFACTSRADCGEGQGCAEGNVYSADFCRPACDPRAPSTCPGGVCTVAGACLARCAIGPDGTPEGCPSEDFTCVRIDAIRDEGVCYPVEGCSRTADCSRDGTVPQLCLNEALGLPATTIGEAVRFDNLYCTAAPDGEGRCPMGYLSFRFANQDGTTTSVCYPPCGLGADGPSCPPATTCFRGFGELVGTPATPPCLPGVFGLPCRDDTHCLVGRCLAVGDGRRACTETCEDAEALADGCEGLEPLSEALGTATRIRCEEVDGADVCVPRFELLALCDDQLECVGDGTECTLVSFGTETEAHVCLRFCVTPQDCATTTGGSAVDYRCIPIDENQGVCSRRRPNGARCAEDADCRDGVCCDVGGFDACLATCG